MGAAKGFLVQRKGIVIRLLYTVFFLIVLEILKLIIQLIVLFQYVYLLITLNPNQPVRTFSNQLLTYAYRIMRYVTLSENGRPFPFLDFPREMEAPEAEVDFK
jgi:hypothetical protein